MKKLIGGFLALLGGIYLFIKSYFYGWASGTPSVQGEQFERYQFLSKILGYSSCALIVGGGLLIYFSIRKMNQEYRAKLNRDNKPDENKQP